MPFVPTITEVKAYLKTYKDKNCKPISKLSNNELRSLARSYGYKGRGQATEMKTEQPEAPTPKTRKPNAWLLYVKEVKKNNPNMAYSKVMQLAKESYVKGATTQATPRTVSQSSTPTPRRKTPAQEEKKDIKDETTEELNKRYDEIVKETADLRDEAGKIVDRKGRETKESKALMKKVKDLSLERFAISKERNRRKKESQNRQ
jgi:hypothetical protein